MIEPDGPIPDQTAYVATLPGLAPGQKWFKTLIIYAADAYEAEDWLRREFKTHLGPVQELSTFIPIIPSEYHSA